MAFPTVADSAESTQSTATTNFSLALPAGIVTGELLLAMVGKRLNDAITWPAGWTTAPTGWTDQTNSTTVRLDIRYRIADGSETSPITLTALSTRWCGVVWRVEGYTGVPEAAGANGSSANADPPNLAPSFGAVDALWVVVAAWDGVPATGNPANYFPDNFFTLGATFTQLRGGSRNLAAASDNPGTFTSTTEQWGAGTLAIQGTTASVVTGTLSATLGALTLSASGTVVTPSTGGGALRSVYLRRR